MSVSSESIIALPPRPPRAWPAAAPGDACAAFEEDGRLVDSLPVGVVVLDCEGRVTRANRAAHDLIGGGLTGRVWRDVVRDDLSLAGAGADADIRGRAGRSLSIEMADPAGAPGQVLVVTDITDARQAQRRLRDLQRVYDTGTLLGTLAHQLRTPLAATMLDADNLRVCLGAGAAADRSIGIAARLVDRLRDMSALVEEMLRFTRGAPLRVELLDLTMLVAGLAGDLGAHATSRGAELRVRAGPAVARVLGSAPALASAIENLVVNAVDAGGAGVTVTLRAGVRDGFGVVTVADDGPGVAPGAEERIFEPLFTTRESGNGLGLAISRAMVEAHRGTLTLVPSTRGAMFEARIPLEPVAHDAAGATR